MDASQPVAWTRELRLSERGGRCADKTLAGCLGIFFFSLCTPGVAKPTSDCRTRFPCFLGGGVQWTNHYYTYQRLLRGRVSDYLNPHADSHPGSLAGVASKYQQLLSYLTSSLLVTLITSKEVNVRGLRVLCRNIPTYRNGGISET
jgi:hypothetical protein